MRNKLWMVLAVVVVLSLAAMAAACTTATPEVQIVKETVVVEKEVTAAPTAEKAKEPVTIVWWTDPALNKPARYPEMTGPGDFEKWVADEYTKDNPHVTVEIQMLDWADLAKKVPAAVAAGAPPDIMKDYLGRSSAYGYEEGIVVPIENIIPQEDIDDILPGLLDLYRINGKLHAMPAYFWEHHLNINMALFEAAGIADMAPLDDNDWTFAEFREAAEALKASGVDYPYALQVASEQGDYDTHAFIWGAGSNTWRNDCMGLDMDNDAALEALTFLNDLYQDGLINPDATTIGWNDQANLFYTGKSAMLGGGLSFINMSLPVAISEGNVTTEMDIAMTMYPHAEGASNGLAVGPTGYFVFEKEGRTAYELEEIAKFLNYINNESWQREVCLTNSQFPSRQSVGAPLAGDPNYELALKLVAERGTESMGLQCPNFPEIRTAMPAFWQAMFLGQATPQETIDGLMEMSADVFSQ